MRTRTAALTLLLSLVTGLVTGCGSDEEPSKDPATVTEGDFAGGTCLVLAADVIGVRKVAVATLKEQPSSGDLTSFADRDYLAAAADRLRQGVPRAGGALAGPLEELVAATAAEATRVGGDDAEGVRAITRLREASEAVTAVCT